MLCGEWPLRCNEGRREPDALVEHAFAPSGAATVREAFRRVFESAASVVSDAEAPTGDEATQLAVWNAIKAIVPRERGGIDLVELRGRLVHEREPIRLTRDVHERIDRKIEKLIREQVETLEIVESNSDAVAADDSR